MEMISPQRVVEILNAHGTKVREEARIILEFMINLARIGLSQTLDCGSRGPVRLSYTEELYRIGRVH